MTNSKRSRQPLSAGVFLRRNLAKTAPLGLVIILAVMLIAGIVALMNSIPHSIRTIYKYMELHTGVGPRSNPMLVPILKKQILEESPVKIERLMTCRATEAEVNSIVGKWPFAVLALDRPDTEFYLKRMQTRSLEGRLPEPSAPEAIISEPIARSLGKKLGDWLLKPDEDKQYSPKRVQIVGIAQSENFFMLMPLEYHKQYHFPPVDLYLVFAKAGEDQAKFDTWAIQRFKGESARVYSYQEIRKNADTMFEILYKILQLVIGVLVIVITIMMAMLMNIYQTQRIPEFGLLQALGYTKKQLFMRILIENVIIVIGGWLIGCAFAFGLLSVVDITLMHPKAFAMDRFDPMAYRYTIPVPIAILATAVFTIMRRLKNFDPVSVLERRLI